MAQIDRSFVHGLFWKMLFIGAVVALVTMLNFSMRLGLSVAVGTLLGAISLRITSFVIAQLFKGVIDSDVGRARWLVILAMKSIFMAAVIWLCLVTMKLHIIAFVVGLKMIFPALVWQMIASPDHLDGPNNETEDPESS